MTTAYEQRAERYTDVITGLIMGILLTLIVTWV
jgi:hypothetical protein